MQAFYTGTNATSVEKPQNGIQGLKHWRKDLLAGLIVSLVSVPLSLGIAVASGAPPICGLISAIIAGLIFPFLGGTLRSLGAALIISKQFARGNYPSLHRRNRYSAKACKGTPLLPV